MGGPLTKLKMSFLFKPLTVQNFFEFLLDALCREGGVVSSELYSFTKSQSQSSAAKDRAKQAAQDEAQRNAGGGNSEAYSMASENSDGNSGDLIARVFLASAAQIPKVNSHLPLSTHKFSPGGKTLSW